ncbi:MAG: alpha-ketoacid dehydrogenase subunit beta [Planctomycetes bacterium]|nr:alpha-ketoacid dehydrogenase subunit beta [Planctomycetota bacterium]
MKQMSIAQALNDALSITMAENERVYCLGEDIGKMGGGYGVTTGLFSRFGAERVRDTPISESAIVGCAVGSAMLGYRPVAEIMFADYLSTCFDLIVNSAAKIHYVFDGQYRAPLVIRATTGGGLGTGAQHAQSPEAWFFNVPGLVIVTPSTPHDAKGLLIASIEDDNPVLFLEHQELYGLTGEVPEGKYSVPLRKAQIVRTGSDVTVVASAKMTHEALAAAAELAGESISAEVIDLRTLRPWDKETVMQSVKKTGRAVVVNEAPKMGNVVSDVSATLAESSFHDLKAPVLRVCGLDTPIPSTLYFERFVLPGRNQIKQAIRSMFS